MDKYNHEQIENKWAKIWVERKIFTPDLNNAKKPYYALFMFPYPSAEGLHIGNFYAFTCVDVVAKYKKLKGFDVFEPVGWDAFGIHSENYALKIGEHPVKMLERTISNFRHQMQSAGLGCDWTREINTTSPDYYKWTQWIFVKLFEKKLAYQKETFLNWCPSCKTVLADEQVEAGKCERCKSISEKRKTKQWFFRITDYANRLLDGLEYIDWSEITKHAQRNWIGKSNGANIVFRIADTADNFSVFTTRPDTIFGCTYCVLAPEHELVKKITSREQKSAVEKYIKIVAGKSELVRLENKEKTGVFTGAYAINPANKKKIPIWISDYVLVGYGSGAIMAVPAHDERDYEFAKKFNLDIIEVVTGGDIKKGAYIGDGVIINSGEFKGSNIEVKKTIMDFVGGEMVVNYKLRDWCISRQRYWGPPLPIIYCEKCGTVAVPEKDLPVVLPQVLSKWEPSGDGHGPLDNVKEFMITVCPNCGGPAKRDSDVMDNFLDSAWYFFRYISSKNKEKILDKILGQKWLPVNLYVGGNEHAVLHLMYTRFVAMFFHDLGLTDFDNPFKKFRANGMILKDGSKMSKSKGNVVSPDEYGKKVGYDALKSYLLFLGPLSEDRTFSDEGIMGTRHWAERIYNLFNRVSDQFSEDDNVKVKFHKVIKKVEEDMEELKFNTAIAALMEMTNTFYSSPSVSKIIYENFLIMVAIFLPALAEELWEKLGNKESIFCSKWPEYDLNFIQDKKNNLIVQINGKVRSIIETNIGLEQDKVKEIVLKNNIIKKWVDGKRIERVIFVKNRLINIVVK